MRSKNISEKNPSSSLPMRHDVLEAIGSVDRLIYFLQKMSLDELMQEKESILKQLETAHLVFRRIFYKVYER